MKHEATMADGSGAMFDRIAQKYDLLNRINSLGMDKGWRKTTIRKLALKTGDEVLDLATGTADVALDVARLVPGVKVVGLDPSAGMLDIGRTKVTQSGQNHAVSLVQGDAQNLGFKDGRFDAITMAFGIRNVPDRPAALKEMVRVLKPRGRVGILELSEPKTGLMAFFARQHIRYVVPRVGAFLSSAGEYQYLQTSIAAFPEPNDFADLMRVAGFQTVDIHPLSFGACVLYVGSKEVQ